MKLVGLRMPAEVDGGGQFMRPRDGFVPGYVRAHEAGVLAERVEQARDLLTPCTVCPRPCKDVDRLADKLGACRIGRYARVASAFPHFGEEDVLRGWHGVGNHLPRELQPAVRVLPERRHQPAPGWPGGHRAGAGRAHAPA